VVVLEAEDSEVVAGGEDEIQIPRNLNTDRIKKEGEGNEKGSDYYCLYIY
jgi:hypothetical protein